ncbi:J domain-containing protein [Elioraea sp.]|uniref:J domain-containing protein n=1 Tax=Elioraea sp. TaxID=2185103 RepID=UPI0021DDEE3A|nr:J domain-containing protein [Elioraea sp.]GIX09491.1 MAG: molecular chaperone DnaJ [Elioraea sp.]
MRNGTVRARRFTAQAAAEAAAAGRSCDHPGCTGLGAFRAPKSRRRLTEYWWFCLDHVREYNRAWDYYKGMTPGEIEAEMRRDTTWQRPSWPLGTLGLAADRLADPLGLVARRRPRRAPPRDEAPPELREPLVALGLVWPVTREDVKLRYKALVKLHHPDAHGGDKAAEERFKTISAAYAALVRGLAAREA